MFNNISIEKQFSMYKKKKRSRKIELINDLNVNASRRWKIFFGSFFFQKGFSFNLIFLLLHSLLSFTPSDPHFQFIQWIFSQLILSLHEIYGIKFVLLIFKCFSVGYKHECCIVYKNIFYILLITLTRTLWLACLIYLKVQIRQFKRESRESKKKNWEIKKGSAWAISCMFIM